MYFFRPPQYKVSGLFVTLAILSHSVSFQTFRGYLLIHLSSTLHLTDIELTNVVYIFDFIYFLFHLVGILLIQSITDKFGFITMVIYLSFLAQLFFYVSTVAFIAKLAYISVAALSGILKVGLFAYGSLECTGNYCATISQYFSIAYIFQTFGHFIALSIVPMDMILQNNCGRINCLSYVMTITMVLEWIAMIAVINCDSKSKIDIKNQTQIQIEDLSKIGRTMAILLPILFVFIIYGDGVGRWMPLVKLMNRKFLWYNLRSHDMQMFDIMTVIICGVVYLIFSKYLVMKPVLTIVFGGVLVSAGLIQLSFVETKYNGFDPRKPVANVSNLFIASNCYVENRFSVQSITINSTIVYDYNFKGSFRPLDWPLNGDKACGSLILLLNLNRRYYQYQTLELETEICLKGKKLFFIYGKCLLSEQGLLYNIKYYELDTKRDLYGRTKVCMLNMNSADHYNFHMKLQQINNPEERYTILANDSLACRTIKEGRYDFISNYKIITKNILFEYGGIYLVWQVNETSIVVVQIRDPPVIPISELLIVIVIVAFGRICIIITGMYVVYSQSSPCTRTMAIGCWLLFITSGSLFDTIKWHTHTISCMMTGIFIGVLTALFLCFALCYANWDYTCINMSTVDDLLLESQSLIQLPKKNILVHREKAIGVKYRYK